MNFTTNHTNATNLNSDICRKTIMIFFISLNLKVKIVFK
jgi:hypothetical protein